MASQAAMTADERRVILASALGTLFEWYDFFLYGALAAIITQQFFAGVNPTAGFIFALLAFAAGFVVRPFGALVFGRLADQWGRKRTFLVTIVMMGLSTFLVGCLPTYEQIGLLAPVALIVLRLLQGLAIGGEYGGAVVYVAEHAPAGRRGLYTGWIQTTANLGLLLSLGVILGCRLTLGEAAFAEWGWRIPFLVSLALLALSVWIRMSLEESPVFLRMKSKGQTSRAPIRETLGQAQHRRQVLAALFGVAGGQAVLWYTAQFYALFFLTQSLKLPSLDATLMIGVSVAVTTPLYVLFARLSDHVGRKPVMITACVLAAISYHPVFERLTEAANPALARAQANAPVVVLADRDACAFQFNPVGTAKFTASCDIVKTHLVRSGVAYALENAPVGSVAELRVGGQVVRGFEGEGLATEAFQAQLAQFTAEATAALRAAGYPDAPVSADVDRVTIVLLLILLGTYAAAMYGPTAITLVELFPARIRTTAMSLPYHIGSGWVGGLLPATAFAMVAATGDMYIGLWYPVSVAVVTAIANLCFIPETYRRDIDTM